MISRRYYPLLLNLLNEMGLLMSEIILTEPKTENIRSVPAVPFCQALIHYRVMYIMNIYYISIMYESRFQNIVSVA